MTPHPITSQRSTLTAWSFWRGWPLRECNQPTARHPRVAGFGSLAVAGAAVLAACGESAARRHRGVDRVSPPPSQCNGRGHPGSRSSFRAPSSIDGSSTVGPISQAVAEEFQKQFRDVRVPVGVSGTGGGFKKFCAEETDVSDASRFIKPTEQELCDENAVGYIELPVAIDGIAVVVNQQNSWIGDSITTAELKTMWAPESEGAIMDWSQIRQGLPNEPLLLYGPGTDSGTYDYFTKVINGEEGASRGDFTPSEDDNVLVQGISGDTGALGFFGLAYFEQNQDLLKALQVDGGDGPVFPNSENILDRHVRASFARDLHLRQHRGGRAARDPDLHRVLPQERRWTGE